MALSSTTACLQDETMASPIFRESSMDAPMAPRVQRTLSFFCAMEDDQELPSEIFLPSLTHSDDRKRSPSISYIRQEVASPIVQPRKLILDFDDAEGFPLAAQNSKALSFVCALDTAPKLPCMKETDSATWLTSTTDSFASSNDESSLHTDLSATVSIPDLADYGLLESMQMTAWAFTLRMPTWQSYHLLTILILDY